MNLIYEAAARGLRVHAQGDRLVVRGPRSEERLAQELLAHKGEILALIQRHPGLENLDKCTGLVLQTFESELVPGETTNSTSRSTPSPGSRGRRG